MSQTVLVTGGCGFIGTWVLRELLARGARAVVLDAHPAPDRWRRVLGDRAAEVPRASAALTARDEIEAVIREHGVTHVIHLAALLTPACQADPFLGCQVNVLGTAAVFDAARRAGGVKAVAVASSVAVHGEGADGPPTFYGAFKQAADLVAGQFWRHFGLRSVAVRPNVVYGPERDQGLTAGPSLACRAAARGEGYAIGYTGPAGYDYVEDVARAFVDGAFRSPPGATVADLPATQATPAEFIRLIEAAAPDAAGRITAAGPHLPTHVPPAVHDIRGVLPDWRPTPLAEGVRKTVEFYRQGDRP